MDVAPGDGDRGHARGPGGPDVERRVADVGGRRGRRAEPLERQEQRLGIRLVALGVVARDDDVERAEEREHVERDLDGEAALHRDDPERPPLRPQVGRAARGSRETP